MSRPLRREDLSEVYTYTTDADLFLWVYQRRRALRVDCPETDFEDAAREAAEVRISAREPLAPPLPARRVACPVPRRTAELPSAVRPNYRDGIAKHPRCGAWVA